MNKTNKSLLVKFLTVLCALCLSLSIVFGLVGCGKDEVTLKNAEINANGELVLTYSDGFVKTVPIVGKDGEDGEDLTECEHSLQTTTTSLKGATADVCYFQIDVCTKCKHTFYKASEHDLEEIEAREATCYAEGLTAGVGCRDCGYMESGEVIEKVAHTMESYFVAYQDPRKTPCIDGGFVVSACTVCKDAGQLGLVEGNYSQLRVDALGHQSTAWEKNEDPTEEEGGTLLADICTACGNTEVEMEIPALTDAKYTKECTKEKEQCTDKEEYTYTITVGAQEFKYVVETAQGNHKITETVTFENNKVYAYDEEIFKSFGNKPKTCGDAGFEVYFACVECGEDIHTKAKLSHQTVAEYNEANEIDVVLNQQYKCADGYYAQYTCGICEETVGDTTAEKNTYLKVNKVAHSYKYTVGDTKYGQDTEDESDDAIDLEGVCIYGCGAENDIEKATATYNKEDANCTTAGKETWTVTAINGEALETPLVAEAEIAIKKHTLDGVDMDLKKVYDWNEWSTKLSSFGNVPQSCSAGGFSVKFVCDVCEIEYLVSAAIPHTIPTDPNPETSKNEAITVVEALCGIKGSTSYVCAKSDCGKTVTTEIAALTHSYTYTMEIEGDTATITGTCVNGDKHTETEEEDNDSTETLTAANVAEATKVVTHTVPVAELTEVSRNAATCEEEGSVTYSWNNGAASATITLEKVAHKLNNKDMDLKKVYELPIEGISVFGNTTPACDEDVPGQGKFICDACEVEFLIGVKKAHTKPEGYEEIVVPCDGQATDNSYTCTTCNEYQEIIVQPSNHNYAYYVASIFDGTEKTAKTYKAQVEISCTICEDLKETLTLPALADFAEANVQVITTASCQEAGVVEYTYSHLTYGELKFRIVTPKVDHDLAEPTLTWTYDGNVYTGKICATEGDTIIITSVTPVPVA